ncbi:MAG: hypothetical protein ACFFF9_09305 [Candidatus Thorarchaeota archaeon]
MKSLGLGEFEFMFWRIRMHLPSRLRKILENGLYSQFLSPSQLQMIETLGENIGLDKEEIHAAVPGHLGPFHAGDRRRMTLFSYLIAILLIVAVSLVILVFTGNYPLSDPSTTYTPGTRYGSISPRDFNTIPHEPQCFLGNMTESSEEMIH